MSGYSRSPRITASVVGVAAALTIALLPVDAAVARPPKAKSCQGRLCAGAGKADITPPVTTPMWGYSARAWHSEFERWAEQRQHWFDTDLYAKVLFLRSEGIHTRLYARSIVLRNGAGTKIALVQTDLGAVTGEIHSAVAKQVEPLGIGRDFLLISATHTHGGPGTIHQYPAHGLLVGDLLDPRTFKRVVDGIVLSIKEANDRLAPARVALGEGRIPNVSGNRSIDPHNANPCPDPQALEEHQCAHPSESEGSDHATDPVVTILRVDRADGVPLGVWSSFAVHGTLFWSDDLRFSGDNQGYAERLIEEGILRRAETRGIKIPSGWEVVSAYANGTEGDQAPYGARGKNRFIRAEDAGRRQAAGVLAAYDAVEPRLVDDLVLDARWDWVYMTGEDGTSPIAILGRDQDPGGSPVTPDCGFDRAPFLPEVIPGHGRKCPFLVIAASGVFPIQVLRIGDLAVAAFPGEPTVQFGRRLRHRIVTSEFNEGKVAKAIVVGLANAYMSYTTTPEEYDLQWYEGTFTLWGRNQGPLLVKRFGMVADALFGGPPTSSLEPLDTSATQADNVTASGPLSPATDHAGPPPGSVLVAPEESVERGSVVGFAWVGGEPSVEALPDEPFVITERSVGPGKGKGKGKGKNPGSRWETLFTDEGFEDLLDYWREGVVDRWGTQWDIPFDAPGGPHRFRIEGRAWESGRVADYQVSAEFEVVPSDDLAVRAISVIPEGVLVKGSYPEPTGNDHSDSHQGTDGPDYREGQPPPYLHTCSAAKPEATMCGNWRMRPSQVTTGEVSVEVVGSDGSVRTASGAYDAARGGFVVSVAVASGDEVRVPSGGVVDEWENFNGAGLAVIADTSNNVAITTVQSIPTAQASGPQEELRAVGALRSVGRIPWTAIGLALLTFVAGAFLSSLSWVHRTR